MLGIDEGPAVQLTEHPFPVLCRSLRGMYPYYTSRGGPSHTVRLLLLHACAANSKFMHVKVLLLQIETIPTVSGLTYFKFV